MKALGLYVRYALRSFIRGRTRSFFGAFCVAVGIASVVSLGLVGGNFRDALTGNAQKLNRGDVSIQFNGQGVSRADYRFFARLKAQGKITDFTPFLHADAMLKPGGGNASSTIIGTLDAVEGQKFPFYDTIKGDRPAGSTLAALLAHPNDAVVSQTVFDQLHLHIGGTVTCVFRFGGARTYTVRGIVPDNAQDPGFGTGLFPYFVMANYGSMTSYSHANNVAAYEVYMKTRTQAGAAQVKRALEARFGPLVSPKTIADVEKDSSNGAAGMDKFFRMMGLVAVIIGGIGIINTMLVAARRRQREISVLKALGMKGRQVVLVFTLEALFLAIAGTAMGLVLGIATSSIVNGITQSLAGYPIPWSLHAQPLIAGVLVGIVATILFAYLPVLRASRSRPVAALRGDGEAGLTAGRFRRYMDTGYGERGFIRSTLRAAGFPFAMAGRGALIAARSVPHPIRSALAVYRSKGMRTAFVVLLLASLLGYLAVLYTGLASGVTTVRVGVMAGIGSLIGAAVLVQIFVGLVWLVSKMPTFGRLTPRMAFRSMGTQRRRLGSTLLALCIGILSIGTIAILAQNIKHELVNGLEKRNNYNVVLQVPHNPAQMARVDHAIASLGSRVRERYDGAIANQATLAAVDGHSVDALTREALAARNHDGSRKYGRDALSQAASDMRALVGRNLGAVPDRYTLEKGRNLGPQDTGTDHIVVPQDVADPYGIKVGSRVVFADGANRVPFTVVGILGSNNFSVLASNEADLTYIARHGLTTPRPDHLSLVILDIPHGSRYSADLSTLRRAVPGGFLLDLDSFLEFTKVIDKMALFPEIIAALALFAGAIIIANTVALAMLERRREIGVMKAVGARRRTILQFLFIENAVVGFLGAGVGVLLAMLATYVVNENLFKFSTSYDWTTVGTLILLGIVLAIGASSLTALPASSEKPMSVLRYE